MYNQKIQSCHQDFQIRKVSCGLRSKTIVTHRNFRTPEDPSVISGISRRLCAISGSSSQSRHSFSAWTRGIFGNGAFRGKSRSSPDFGSFAASKVEVRLEVSCVHTYLTGTAHSARLIPRSTGSHRRLVAVNEQSRSSPRRVTRRRRARTWPKPRSARFSLNRLTPSARGCQRAAWEGEACSAAASHGRI